MIHPVLCICVNFLVQCTSPLTVVSVPEFQILVRRYCLAHSPVSCGLVEGALGGLGIFVSCVVCLRVEGLHQGEMRLRKKARVSLWSHVIYNKEFFFIMVRYM